VTEALKTVPQYKSVTEPAVRFLDRFTAISDLPRPNLRGVTLLLEQLATTDLINCWSTVLEVLGRSTVLLGYSGLKSVKHQDKRFECHLTTLMTARKPLNSQYAKPRTEDLPYWRLLTDDEYYHSSDHFGVVEKLETRVLQATNGYPGRRTAVLTKIFDRELQPRSGAKRMPDSRIFPHERPKALEIAEQMDRNTPPPSLPTITADPLTSSTDSTADSSTTPHLYQR
jgi:hypothetical protein